METFTSTSFDGGETSLWQRSILYSAFGLILSLKARHFEHEESALRQSITKSALELGYASIGTRRYAVFAVAL